MGDPPPLPNGNDKFNIMCAVRKMYILASGLNCLIVQSEINM